MVFFDWTVPERVPEVKAEQEESDFLEPPTDTVIEIDNGTTVNNEKGRTVEGVSDAEIIDKDASKTLE